MENCQNLITTDSLIHHYTFVNDLENIVHMEDRKSCPYNEISDVKPTAPNDSPAKVAPFELESSSESMDLSDSSDAGNLSTERSRPAVRSATPRRSASPMRRIQIGRSGPRKSPVVTIKSLNHFQLRDRSISYRDVDTAINEEEELEHLPIKPEKNVGRMSVQDAINLFESKQNDQNLNVQRRKTSAVTVSANKSVLRRWSSGMGDSIIPSTQRNEYDSYRVARSNLDTKSEDNVLNRKTAPICIPAEIIWDNPLENITPEVDVSLNNNGQSSTTDWNRKKEAELNEMLIKMMGDKKPARYCSTKVGKDVFKDTSVDQRGGFYSQYNAKRNEKYRAENARTLVTKEAQNMLSHETLKQSKNAMSSKPTTANVKCEFTNISQKTRRNSSPPVLSRKEISIPVNKRKVYSKSLPLQTQSSIPSNSSKKVVHALPSKGSHVVSTGSTLTYRKSQSSSSPAQQSNMTKPSLNSCNNCTKVVQKKRETLNPQSSLSGQEGFLASTKPSVQSKSTRKSSVVPLESKPFLRKGSGINPVNGFTFAKAKEAMVSKLSIYVKTIENDAIIEEHESTLSSDSTMKLIEDDIVQPSNVVDALAAPIDNDNVNNETVETVLDGSPTRIKLIISENQHDDNMGISSAAWVDAEKYDHSPPYNSKKHHIISPVMAPARLSSSRVRQSLSQMLQADSGELEIIEWGHAENPPSLVYHKDSPKGLKKLLKFTRKSKGDGNLSLPTFTEAEEHKELKTAIKERADTSRRLVSLQDKKDCGRPKNVVNESLDGPNSIERTTEHSYIHGNLSGSDNLKDGRISTGVSATKAARSFFSLSSLRSSKSSIGS